MNSLIQWLTLFALTFLTPALSIEFPRLTPLLETIIGNPSKNSSTLIHEDFQTFYYNQTLDHFNYNPESYTIFQQRYVINEKYWGGAKSHAPIFAYLGAEAPIDGDMEAVGFLTDNAPQFKSLLVYIEHRYYGQSIPFGSFQEAMDNRTLRGYFNSAQALADYAEVVLHIKKIMSADHSPVIVLGGSYGGMLASWFRLKYPHIAVGALASSAPILYFDDITPQDGYYSVVTKDFKKASKGCYETIKTSWSVIDEVASKPNGLQNLSRIFKTCRPLGSADELRVFLEIIFMVAAQYNAPPHYPVSAICRGIDGAPKGTDVLGRISTGVAAFAGNITCYDTSMQLSKSSGETALGFHWQMCSEMVIPMGVDNNDTMFKPEPFNLANFIENCKELYGVTPRPHWVTSYYGGRDIKRVLSNFASNIIFSNGLSDPYSSGGVLVNISDTVRSVTTPQGSHCLDILSAKPSDPQWLVEQRQTEVGIIRQWLSTYYDDLLLFKR